MPNGKTNLFDYLERYFKPAKALNMRPLLLLDTSAIIDLEQSYQKRYGLRQAHQFLGELEAIAGEGAYLLPAPVFEEVKMHHAHCIINGRPEISQQTYERLRRKVLPASTIPDANSNLEQASEQLTSLTPLPNTQRSLDDIKYCLRLLCTAELCGKKAERDPISRTDWEVIDTALAYGVSSLRRFLTNMGNMEEQFYQHCYKVAVLSSDEHIVWTLSRSFAEPECVEFAPFLTVVDTRLYHHLPGGLR